MTFKLFEKNFVLVESVHSYITTQNTENDYFLLWANKTMSQIGMGKIRILNSKDSNPKLFESKMLIQIGL